MFVTFIFLVMAKLPQCFMLTCPSKFTISKVTAHAFFPIKPTH